MLKAEPGFQGTVAAAECVTLQRGTYRIQAVAWSEGDGNRLEIYSPRHLNEDNTEGQLVAESDLGKNGELLETTFQVTESLEDISFRVWYDGEGDFNITSLYLTSTGRMYQDPFILMGLIVLASLLILLGRMKWGERIGRKNGLFWCWAWRCWRRHCRSASPMCWTETIFITSSTGFRAFRRQ